MAGLVVVTFDIEEASGEDYQAISEELAEHGLKQTVTGDTGVSSRLPANTYTGEFSVEDSGAFRDEVTDLVKNVIKGRGLKGTVFVLVAGRWAWGRRKF